VSYLRCASFLIWAFNSSAAAVSISATLNTPVTKPLKVTVNRFTCGTNPLNKKAMCAGDITANIKRSEFGMTKYIPTVSDDIKISVPVEAYKD